MPQTRATWAVLASAAELSRLAYEEFEAIASSLNTDFFRPISSSLFRRTETFSFQNDRGETRYFDVEGVMFAAEEVGSNRIHIVFRGTDELGELLNFDVRLFATEIAQGGYSESLLRYAGMFVEKVREIIGAHPGKDVVFSGHSLGGMVAEQFTQWFYDPTDIHGLAPDGRVVTGFGIASSGVMDVEWAPAGRFYHVTHTADLVGIFRPDYHIGPTIRIVDEGAIGPFQEHSHDRYAQQLRLMSGSALNDFIDLENPVTFVGYTRDQGIGAVIGGAGFFNFRQVPGSNGVYFGTDYADRIEATGGAYIDGGQGHDRIVGSGGTDFLAGGDGDDHLEGRGGDDHLYGGNGGDTYHIGFNQGFDTIDERGGAGRDTLRIYTDGTITAIDYDWFTVEGADLRVRIPKDGGGYLLDVRIKNMGTDAGGIERVELIGLDGVTLIDAWNLADIWFEKAPSLTSVGGEFRINTYTYGDQGDSQITALVNGGFVVTWISSGQDGLGSGVYAQVYDASGGAVGGEFRANASAEGYRYSQTITALENGGFVVAWDCLGQDGSDWGVYAQVYDGLGGRIGGEFRVNTHVTGSQSGPQIAALGEGRFVVTWQSHSQDGDGFGIYAQVYDASGGPIGGEFRVNTYTEGEQNASQITALEDGGFVIVWVSYYGQDGSGVGVYAQVYDALGVAVGGEFRVNTHTATHQDRPQVTALESGGFVVTWDSGHEEGLDIYAQLYDASGGRIGDEYRVNTTTAGQQADPQVASLEGGGFVITWQLISEGPGWFDPPQDIYAQVYDASGDPVGQEFRVNTWTMGVQRDARIATLDGGGFVVTWMSYTPVGSGEPHQDGSGAGIYAQVYDAMGRRSGEEFRVNSYTEGGQVLPQITALEGGFVVTWDSVGQDGSDRGIYAQVYQSAPTVIVGAAADDVLVGTRGNDVMRGLAGDDILEGGDGDARLIGGLGADVLNGGAGNDTASHEGSNVGVVVRLSGGVGQSGQALGVAANLASEMASGGHAEGDTLISIENLIGSAFDDVLIGNASSNGLYGEAAADILIGGAGDDTIDGGDGYDIAVYSGARGGYATATHNQVSGGVESGTDTLTGVESLAFVDGQLTFHRDGMAAQVMRLYDSAFDRIPDASGFEAQLDAMEGGLSLDALAQLFVDSPEFQNTYGALSDRAFIEQLYRNVLDREGEEAGIQNALSQLATQPGGTMTRGQLLVAFSESEEHKNLTQGTLDQGLWIADEQTLIIARLYDSAWNRLPDEGGLITWRNALGGGMSLVDIADAFAGAAEFTNTYGTLTDREFVEQLYRNVLDREGDEGGIQNALNAIADGWSRGDVMLAFSESAEHIALTRDLWIGGVSLYGSSSAFAEAKDASEPQTLPGVDDFMPLDAVNDDALVLPGVDDALVWAKEADEALVLPGIDDGSVFVTPDHNGFGHDFDTSLDDAFHGLRNEGWMH